MSREFGENGSGFFHWKIYNALQDLKDADYDFHKRFVPIFERLYDLSYVISSVEACDSGLDRSITSSMDLIPLMIKDLEAINEDLQVYRDVASKAVQDALGDK